MTETALETCKLFTKKLGPGEAFARHTHVTDSYTLVVDGSYDEEFKKDFHRCGLLSLQYKPAGIPHTTRAGSAGTRMFIMTVAPPRADSIPRDIMLGCGVPTALALRLWSLLNTDGDLGCVAGLFEGLVDAVRGRFAPRDDDVPDWIADARHRVADLEPVACRLDTLAGRVHFHPVHLARVFRRHMGCSVGAYLRRCRIDSAVEALVGDDIPLGALAQRLGYYDQSHFCRDFRRETGTTPLAIRRAARCIAA